MFEVIEEWTRDGVVALRVSGKLAHEDYENLVPMLVKEIETYGVVRCLVDLTKLDGVELRAVLDELRFDLKHATDVSRCAVVGDRAWERWATAAARPIFRKADVAFFAPEEIEKAISWVRQGTEAK